MTVTSLEERIWDVERKLKRRDLQFLRLREQFEKLHQGLITSEQALEEIETILSRPVSTALGD